MTRSDIQLNISHSHSKLDHENLTKEDKEHIHKTLSDSFVILDKLWSTMIDIDKAINDHKNNIDIIAKLSIAIRDKMAKDFNEKYFFHK